MIQSLPHYDIISLLLAVKVLLVKMERGYFTRLVNKHALNIII